MCINTYSNDMKSIFTGINIEILGIKMNMLKINATEFKYINPEIICCIESNGKYSNIYVIDEVVGGARIENGFKKVISIEYSLKNITVFSTLHALQKVLPSFFCRVNRFNILNLNNTIGTRENEIFFRGGLKRKIKGKIKRL